MKILGKNRTALYIGTWNRTRLMTLVIVLISLFSFQVANAQGGSGGGGGGGGGALSDLVCKGCVDTSDIAKSAVTNSKIKKGAVSNSKLGSGAVSTSKLRSGAVSTSKIQNGAVTVDKVSPELRNAIGTSCPAGESVVGMDVSGNFVCESKLARVLDTDLTGKTYCVRAQGTALIAEAGLAAQVELNPFHTRVDFTSPTQLTITDVFGPNVAVGFPSYTMSHEDDAQVSEGTYTMVGNQLAVTIDDEGESLTLFFTLTPDGQVFIGGTAQRESAVGFEGFWTYIHIGVLADSCT